MPAAHYKIFEHPRSGDTAAVKVGFSWPAFFFGFIWALFMRLWLVAIELSIASMVACGIGVVLAVSASDAEFNFLLLYVPPLLVSVLVGQLGNWLHMGHLKQCGFEIVDGVSASSPTYALAVFSHRSERRTPSS